VPLFIGFDKGYENVQFITIGASGLRIHQFFNAVERGYMIDL
jgi:hypothetical protein